MALPGLGATPDSTTPPPSTPREFFNAGTARLNAGKLKEAGPLLESALDSQENSLQPPAVFNLGHVRFRAGTEELKKGPSANAAANQGRHANAQSDAALRDADAALAGDDMQKIVAAYLNGRGARKELKAARQAVKQAMESYAATLNYWQRSSGDFKSALELDPAAGDARNNAEVVDRCIAKLVDSLKQLQQLAGMMGDKNRDLGQKLKQLRGRMPDNDAPPGGGGDDEEDEDSPRGPRPGEKEGATKEGEKMTMSPEQAGWFLQGYRLDSERRLPMGNAEGEPKKRGQKPW